jgi:hypothetical protein
LPIPAERFFFALKKRCAMCMSFSISMTRNTNVVLHPFGEMGHEPTSHELVEESRRLKAASKEMSERAKALLADALQSIAAIKERKKSRPFDGTKTESE